MKTLRERFEARLIPGENGCLEWTGYRMPTGYGTIKVDGKKQLAHRVAWMLANGEIPEGLQVLHTCDNPACCAVDHLFLGTHDDNMADKVSKGRQGRTGSGNRVVDSDMAHFMFILAAEGHSKVAIGKRLGVHNATVCRYLSGKRVVKL